ncbi:MAG: EVE domain-containing protein [Pirellulales bacterium]|nr:EVE domain-containing protein [Pirellulales bacterium]
MIESLDELHDNLARFRAAVVAQVPEALTIARQVHYWVYDPASDTFAPCLFAAYRNMTMELYRQSSPMRHLEEEGATFDGTVAWRAVAKLVDDPIPDDKKSRSLERWLARHFGEAGATRFNKGKWRFCTLRGIHYWAFACDPRKYDALSACSVLDDIAWTADRLDPRVGDRAILWQAKGGGADRGIVGLGEIVEGPAVFPENEEERRFWKDEAPGLERRVRIRLIEAPGLPLWESSHSDLSKLAVARARGGTVFTLQEAQWQQICELAAAIADGPDKPEDMGQGWMSDPRCRRAVELHAQAIVEEHFSSLGYRVSDVSANRPYDLLCSKDDEERHVEVKGCTGIGETVFLTRNEVTHVRENPAMAVLALVTGIELRQTGGNVEATGGELRVIEPWTVLDGDLVAIQFQYKLPRI